MAEMETMLRGLVRVGTVMNRDVKKRLARVKFEDFDGMISDWLPVLITRDFIPDYEGLQRTEYAAGGSGAAAYANHKHDLIIRPWMPKLNEQVLVLYVPLQDADGIVLGGIQTWR